PTALTCIYTLSLHDALPISIEGIARYAPVRPAKGQMAALRADELRIERVLWSEKIYLVPRNDGRIVAGATVEYTGFDKRTTAGGDRKSTRLNSSHLVISYAV